MKTLIIYEEVPDRTRLFLVDGDRRDLNGHFVNSTANIPENIHNELCDPERFFGKEVKPPVAYSGDMLYIVHCGFLL